MSVKSEFIPSIVKRVPLIHHEELAPKYLTFMKNVDMPDCSEDRPSNLQFMTVHNYDGKSLFEESLDLFKLDCTTLKSTGKWKYTNKILLPLEYVKANVDPEQIIVFCDAGDVILKRHPKLISQVFDSYECEILFMTTAGPGGYACMPDKLAWHQQIYGNRFLNSGVYVGRAGSLVELWSTMLPYCGDDPIDKIEFHALGMAKPGDNRVCQRLPNFPLNAMDQDIYRFVHKDFYPRMKIDIRLELAWRS